MNCLITKKTQKIVANENELDIDNVRRTGRCPCKF